jgi:hypothetical protein
MKLGYKCTSPLDDGLNYIASVKYYFGNQSTEEAVNRKFGEEMYFDVSKHLNYFSSAARNTVQVEVTDAYGNKSLKTNFNFYLIELTLTSDATPINAVNKSSADDYRYPCKPKGGTGLESLYIELALSPINN